MGVTITNTENEMNLADFVFMFTATMVAIMSASCLYDTIAG